MYLKARFGHTVYISWWHKHSCTTWWKMCIKCILCNKWSESSLNDLLVTCEGFIVKNWWNVSRWRLPDLYVSMETCGVRSFLDDHEREEYFKCDMPHTTVPCYIIFMITGSMDLLSRWRLIMWEASLMITRKKECLK